MANLLKHSIALLLVSSLVLVTARHHSDDEKTKGFLNFSQSQDDDESKIKLSLKFNRKHGDDGDGHAGGDKGCVCEDSKFKEFMQKLSVLSKAYISKEFLPDLQKSALKAGRFYMDFLAKEKPQEVEKLTKVLERSAKATSDAMIRNGVAFGH